MSNISKQLSPTTLPNLDNEHLSEREHSPDLVMALCSMLGLCGLFVDGWAHFHGRVDESFFTPYHALLYGSMVVLMLTLSFYIYTNSKGTSSLKEAIPAHYGVSVVGVIVFSLGGLADMWWHTVFGIEQDVEALISPSHLLIVLGGIMVGGAPLRAAWFRPNLTLTIRQSIPIILVTAGFLSLLSFFTVYLHPLSETPPIRDFRRWSGLSHYQGQQIGMASAILQAMVMMGILLLVSRRWRWSLPFGSITAILTINASLMSVLRDNYDLVLAYLVAGLIGDVLIRMLNPKERIRDVRLIAFLIPFTLMVSYYLLLMQRGGFDWSFPMWSGAAVLSGVAGYLVSLLAAPPLPITSLD